MPIILVHGAWGGSWSWSDAAKLLRQRGYEVHAPTLSGLAERSHIPPQHISLSSHISDIAGLMRYENLTNALLVGHSYGGSVITGAADREIERVAGMIYVDASVLESGQSLWDILPPAMRQAQQESAQAHDGGHSLPRGIRADTDHPLAAHWQTLFTPQPIRCLEEKWISTREVQSWPPRHYFLCTADPNNHLRAFGARFQNAPGWGYGEFNEFHDVVRANPQLVADAIAKTAENWGVRPDNLSS